MARAVASAGRRRARELNIQLHPAAATTVSGGSGDLSPVDHKREHDPGRQVAHRELDLLLGRRCLGVLHLRLTRCVGVHSGRLEFGSALDIVVILVDLNELSTEQRLPLRIADFSVTAFVKSAVDADVWPFNCTTIYTARDIVTRRPAAGIIWRLSLITPPLLV